MNINFQKNFKWNIGREKNLFLVKESRTLILCMTVLVFVTNENFHGTRLEWFSNCSSQIFSCFLQCKTSF